LPTLGKSFGFFFQVSQLKHRLGRGSPFAAFPSLLLFLPPPSFFSVLFLRRDERSSTLSPSSFSVLGTQTRFGSPPCPFSPYACPPTPTAKFYGPCAQRQRCAFGLIALSVFFSVIRPCRYLRPPSPVSFWPFFKAQCDFLPSPRTSHIVLSSVTYTAPSLPPGSARHEGPTCVFLSWPLATTGLDGSFWHPPPKPFVPLPLDLFRIVDPAVHSPPYVFFFCWAPPPWLR